MGSALAAVALDPSCLDAALLTLSVSSHPFPNSIWRLKGSRRAHIFGVNFTSSKITGKTLRIHISQW